MPSLSTRPSGSADLADLMAKTALADRAAFAALHQATNAKLFGVALALLRRRELAEEILQEAYLRIWRRSYQYDHARSSPISWMVAIVRNLAIDHLRNRGELQNRHDTCLDYEEALLTLADERVDLFEQVRWSCDRKRLSAALNRLDPVKRRLVIAAYVDGESRAQLADRFGVPVPTVKSWLRRAIWQMRTSFEGLDAPEKSIAA